LDNELEDSKQRETELRRVLEETEKRCTDLQTELSEALKNIIKEDSASQRLQEEVDKLTTESNVVFQERDALKQREAALLTNIESIRVELERAHEVFVSYFNFRNPSLPELPYQELAVLREEQSSGTDEIVNTLRSEQQRRKELEKELDTVKSEQQRLTAEKTRLDEEYNRVSDQHNRDLLKLEETQAQLEESNQELSALSAANEILQTEAQRAHTFMRNEQRERKSTEERLIAEQQASNQTILELQADNNYMKQKLVEQQETQTALESKVKDATQEIARLEEVTNKDSLRSPVTLNYHDRKHRNLRSLSKNKRPNKKTLEH